MVVPDVENKDYVFTDGSGFLAQSVLNLVAKKFKFEQVSAIQMRYAGFKGVLVAHPGLSLMETPKEDYGN